MHEIVSVQLGQRSNYLATHFWNTQESYFTYSDQKPQAVNHDVHFRAGRGADGNDTFTPRTVIYDLKGGFGTLRKFNALYEIEDPPSSAQGVWDGTTARQLEQPIQPSEYQRNLDLGLPTSQLHASDVRYWSDFNRVFYHPRSIVQLNEYELNSQLMPFENWSAGQELFDSLDKQFDILDRDLRPFVEECDQMQGFQFFTGSDDAWGGFSAKYLDSLRDEYGKTSTWVWGVEDSTRVVRQKQLVRACNSARSLQAIGQHASAYIRLAAPPASLPGYVNFQAGSDWMTTALLCAGLESSTLPTRLLAQGSNRGSLSLLEDTLNTTGSQNLFELQASVTSAVSAANGGSNGSSHPGTSVNNRGAQAITVSEHPEPSSLDLDYTPTLSDASTASSTHVFAQVECERDHLGAGARPLSLTPDERLRRRLNEKSVVEIFQTGLQFPLLDTFPDRLLETSRQAAAVASHSGQGSTGGLDILAALVCHSRTRERILDLRNTTFRLMQVDEREALYNDLTQMAQNYSTGWDSGSDSGVDED